MSSIVISGDTSGSVTLQAPAIAGSTTLTLQAVSGTVALTSGATAFTDLTVTNGASIQGLTVGRGAGAVSGNTTVGASALAGGSQTGTNLTALGFGTLNANSSGGNNTAVGASALQNNSTASGNTVVGYRAGFSNTTGTVTAVGTQALQNNTTGDYNTAMGSSALLANTTGPANSAFGLNALTSNTTGGYNTGLGVQALNANTTASNSTAVGYQAGYTSATSGQANFFGYQAGYSFNVNNADCGTCFIGSRAGYSTTSGTKNTFLGEASGYYMTTGSGNTILGRYTGNQGGLDIRTASNYIVLSDGDGNPRMYFNGSGYVFAPAVFLTVSTALSGAILGTDDVGLFTVSASGQKRIIPRKPNDPSAASDNLIDLGDSGSRFRVIYAGTGTINTSDANEKQQIRDLNVAEKAVALRIKSLIKAYKFNDAVALKGDNARIHIGVLAQEVALAFEAEGLDAYKYSMFCSDTWYEVNGNTIDDKNQLVTKDTPNAIARTRLGVRYDELLAFVIAAM